jgi:phytoene/squalene synthetase
VTGRALDQVLDALVEQEVVRYAAVTSPGGTMAEAGDLPAPPSEDDPVEASLNGAAEALKVPARAMVEVGDGCILQLGTTEALPEEELQQLRSVVASAM